MHNFGKIKHNIYEIAVDGIVDKDAKKKALLKKYISTIKESEILRTQARVYHNIENKVNENEFIATEYIKENMALMSKYDLQDIVRETKKLSVLLEGHEVEEIYDLHDLHENIHNLIITKRKPNTVDTIVESTNVIKNYILNNKYKEFVSEEFLPNSMLMTYLGEKFNKKYADLDENEQKVLKTILESDEEGHKVVLENLKKEALVLVNKSLTENTDTQIKEKLLNVKERILETQYSKDEFIPTVTRIIDLTKTLSN